ncbi:ferritin-like domain-containing protein [Gallibacterium anatis]|uniref:ferritin-like domain-containing protein n=1 Tax=Gallibacterium anatis TaxID=750 RepID=UPI0039FD88E4
MTPEIIPFWQAITTALSEKDPQRKCDLVNQLMAQDWQWQLLENIDNYPIVTPNDDIVGIPDKPTLVAPQDVPKRAFASAEGYAATFHAIAHIEFNAINLGLDAAWRFGRAAQQQLGQGIAFVKDWLKVAHEETYHFSLVKQHLASLGYQYGDFEAHAGLWEMAQATAHDIWQRMALVPRVLEARGLDATPPLREKMAQRKDMRAVEILTIILNEEIGHVAIGNHWYHTLCQQRHLDPLTSFSDLLRQYRIVIFKGVINTDARLQAGFTQFELDWIKEIEESLKRERVRG